jgi:predicted nucleotidyltransferase
MTQEPSDLGAARIRDRRRHRGIIRLSPVEIAQILNLPDDVSLWTVRGNWDPMSIDLLVVSDRLPEMDENAEAPLLSMGAHVERRIDEDGRTWVSMTIPGLEK